MSLSSLPVLSPRQLLAIPFVGKDVPSQASEFAHPDVLIGFFSRFFSSLSLLIFFFRLEYSCISI